jgi:hypothetical protein
MFQAYPGVRRGAVEILRTWAETALDEIQAGKCAKGA